jgi:iron complex transport system ATP-binding protein
MRELSASGLIVRRGGRAVLDAVSLSAKSGEFVAVIGANGAGKSTLLSALSGLLRPESGTIAMDGKPLAALSRRELAKARAYLPQSPRCEWPITVERLVALGLTPVLPSFGGFPHALQIRIDAALAACDLLARRDQTATTLSGGELARAMLARALAGDPDILIADEPIAGLDPRHVLDTAARLRLLAEQGKLVIAAIHDLTIAMRYATRVVALHHGRVAADGPCGTALTADVLRGIFDVNASIIENGTGGTYVDFRPAEERTLP